MGYQRKLFGKTFATAMLAIGVAFAIPPAFAEESIPSSPAVDGQPRAPSSMLLQDYEREVLFPWLLCRGYASAAVDKES